jgi:hypothetical protein
MVNLRTIVLILTLFSAVGLQAGKRTKDEMKAAALGVLSQNSASRAAVAVSSASDLKEYLANEHLSVIGSDDLGFAVVTTDDHARPVIGYSTTPFTETMPDGFKWWLEKAETALPAQRSMFNVQHSKVDPLMTTKWGQEYPYNAKLRYIIGDNTYQFMTGCVATAMAQVMNYHRFPRRGHGSVRYVLWNYQTWMFHTFTETYNWDVMLDQYSYQSAGGLDEAAKAVSVLMHDCGMAVKMNYDIAVSLANTDDIAPALIEYFSYDESGTRQVRRADYSEEEWMQLIYDELSAGRPVIYSGINRNNPDKTYGHTFVVHGCDADGLVYVNWGWRGQHDGFFDINLLSANGSSFNDDQDMILVKPGTHDQCAVKVIATGAGKVHLGDVTNAVADTTKIYKVDEGASVTLTAIPDDGWRISHVFVGQDEVTAQVKDGQYTLDRVDDNMTLSVTFEKIPIQYCALRITARGEGSVTCDSIEVRNAANAIKVEKGTDVQLVVTPDEGWQIHSVTINGHETLDESGYDSCAIKTTVATNVDIAVEFTKKVYHLTYWVDGAVYRRYEVEYGASIVPENVPAKEGYTFGGWSDIPSNMPAGNVNVSGSFTVNQYLLTFQVDGEECKAFEVEYGSLIIPLAEPVKEGYTFSGWIEMPETMPAHDVIVTGRFTVNTYEVTYMVDGTVFLTDSLTYQSPIPLPTVPERSGYDFEWDEHPETMPAYDVTITGNYTVETSVASSKVGPAFKMTNGTLYLSGLQSDEHVTLYTLSGKCLLTARATTQGTLAIPLPQLPSALYIIRTSRQVFEIAR